MEGCILGTDLLLQHKLSQGDHLFNMNRRADHEGWGREQGGAGWGGVGGWHSRLTLPPSGAFPKKQPFRQFERATYTSLKLFYCSSGCNAELSPLDFSH